MWRGRGRPHTVPAPGCPLHPVHQCICLPWVPLCWAGVRLMFPPLPGSEGNPMPAEQSPVVTSREDTAPAAHPGHPLHAEVPGPPAAGASGPAPAASGGRSHLGWRLRRGQKSLVTWLLCGNVQVPCKNAHDPNGKGLWRGTDGGWVGGHQLWGPSRSPGRGNPGRALEEKPNPQW